MSLRADIEAVYADGALDDAQRRAAIYRIKTHALVAEIKRRLIDRPYTHNGASYHILEVMAGPQDQLIYGIEINGERHTVVIVNPPLLPREPTGNERRDLRRAVREMLEGIGV